MSEVSASVHISGSEDTIVSGIYHQIEAVMLRCQRRPRWLYKSITSILLPFLGSVIGGTLYYFVGHGIGSAAYVQRL